MPSGSRVPPRFHVDRVARRHGNHRHAPRPCRPRRHRPFSAASLTSAAASLAGDLQAARQEAVTRNLGVEIHFYSDGEYVRHYATYRLGEDGRRIPIAPLVALPDGVVISEDSTLTKIGTPAADVSDLPDSLPAGALTYSFRFLPDGSTGLDLSEKWFLTVVGENTDEIPPPNFATIQIEPLTGSVRVHRP